MVKIPFACSECHRILPEDDCHQHPGALTTTDWQGYVVVLDPNRSDIGQRLNLSQRGTYALKVNIR